MEAAYKKVKLLKSIYRFFRKVLSKYIEKPMLKLLYTIGMVIGIWKREGYYIVRIDGGISSQIEMYLLGLALKKTKGNDVNILYDLTWFKECGMDLNNVYVRNFDLLKLYPNLEFEEVTPLLRTIYYKCYRFETQWREYKSLPITDLPTMPLYLDGYGYQVSAQMKNQIYNIDGLMRLPQPNLVLDSRNLEVLTKIQTEKMAVAVQVRRGDMATAGFTTRPLEPQYFIKAICSSYFEGAVFYFFSDEMQWVYDEIIPCLDQSIKYYIVDINGSDKGYMDLYLCANCRHFVSSQGSFGEKAAMLGAKEGSILVMPKFRYYEGLKEMFPQLTIYTIDENCMME